MNISLTYDSIIRYLQMAVDIIVVWILIYSVIKLAKINRRTVQIFQGVILVLIVRGLANLLGLTTVAWITENVVSWGFLALIVIFQPEIRSLLERLGKNNGLARISALSSSQKEHLIDELVAATASLSQSKTGALITLEQSNSLNDYIKTGVALNSAISAELLCSIFVTDSPLHDGAVIIQGDRIACASAYFTPTTMELPSRFGARHRAAIGISEITDAVTIVVSEESGRVSVTTGGKIYQMTEHKLREFLEKIILNKETVTRDTSNVTRSDSVSIDAMVAGSLNDPEVDFASDNNRKKMMKTFESADFKADVERAEKAYTAETARKPGNSTIRKVVDDIAKEHAGRTGGRTAGQVVSDLKTRLNNTAAASGSVPKISGEVTPPASGVTIKTENVVDGSQDDRHPDEAGKGGAQQ
jgi:uncharacterized protein (TIGR00159 family)